MVDIHCHILPGFDDGSDNLEESVRMAKLAVSGGTKAIITTPTATFPVHIRTILIKIMLKASKL